MSMWEHQACENIKGWTDPSERLKMERFLRINLVGPPVERMASTHWLKPSASHQNHNQPLQWGILMWVTSYRTITVHVPNIHPFFKSWLPLPYFLHTSPNTTHYVTSPDDTHTTPTVRMCSTPQHSVATTWRTNITEVHCCNWAAFLHWQLGAHTSCYNRCINVSQHLVLCLSSWGQYWRWAIIIPSITMKVGSSNINDKVNVNLNLLVTDSLVWTADQAVHATQQFIEHWINESPTSIC